MGRYSQRLGLWCVNFFIAWPTLVLAGDGDTHQTTLDNGLLVVVREDHRAPVAVTQVWYKVGSSYEPQGITGLSHMLEHMMFKGTEQHPKDNFSMSVSADGGILNAFTADDVTVYHEQVAASKVPQMLALEADRMVNIVLNPDDLRSELQVVKEERRMRIEDSPEGHLFERFNAAAFISSPYHHPTIGWMHDIDQYNTKDLREWYQKWYAPNNAIVVVVGDVDPKSIMAEVEKQFGHLSRREIPVLKNVGEVEPLGERRVQVKVPAKLPQLFVGYNVPVVTTAKEAWEPYALLVLANILSGSDSARLPRELVREQQVLNQADVYYDILARLDQLLILSGVPAQGHTITEAEVTLLAQIQRLQTELVSDAELTRVKTNVKAARIYDKDSMGVQAEEIGTYTALGLPWQLADEFVPSMEAVTAQQIQQVAQKYLIADRRTVAILDPQPMTTDTPITSPGDMQHVR